MTDKAPTTEPRTHTFLDRLLGRHAWVIQSSSHYYFRAGGSAMFEYECFCGALRERQWDGDHAEGRRMTDEEREAVGPYL